jgi:hypothetical protein
MLIENRALIALHRPEYSPSPTGIGHTACRRSGNTTHALTANGRSIMVAPGAGKTKTARLWTYACDEQP